MTDNLRIWNALGKTDPKHTKPFSRAGGFKGTAIKPIWTAMRMTEHFGPCGVGWGMGKPDFQTVASGEDILVFCTVGLWYIENTGGMAAVRGEVFGVGGDKCAGKNKNGPYTDDEAFKKAFTDAIGNAMKQIGVAADVHMGLFDDSKYVNEMKREFADDAAPPAEQPPAQRAPAAVAQTTAVKFDAERFHADALKQLAGKNVGECRAWWKQNLGALGMLETERRDLWLSLKNFCSTAGGDVRMAG